MRIRTPISTKKLEKWSVYGTKPSPSGNGNRMGFENNLIMAFDADEAEAIYNRDSLGYTAEIVKQISCFPYVIRKEIPRK